MTDFAKNAFCVAVGCLVVSGASYALNEAFNFISPSMTTYGKIPLHEAPKAFLAISMAVAGVGTVAEIGTRVKNGIYNSLSR